MDDPQEPMSEADAIGLRRNWRRMRPALVLFVAAMAGLLLIRGVPPLWAGLFFVVILTFLFIYGGRMVERIINGTFK